MIASLSSEARGPRLWMPRHELFRQEAGSCPADEVGFVGTDGPGPPPTEPLETSAVATCTTPWIPSHDFYVRCEWKLLCKSRPLRHHMSFAFDICNTSEIRRAVDLQTVPVSKSNHLLAPHISPTHPTCRATVRSGRCQRCQSSAEAFGKAHLVQAQGSST